MSNNNSNNNNNKNNMRNSDLNRIDYMSFYSEYHGHKMKHLRKLLPALRSSSDSLLWTAGDSSLDNKFWFPETAASVGAYSEVLRPPISKCDVTYWLNYLLAERKFSHQQSKIVEDNHTKNMAAINTAVEATTLNQRVFNLLAQDKFIRDNISENDVLVVSIGGNDVALAPAPCTIASLCGLLCLPAPVIASGNICCTMPVDDCCCGCGASLLSCGGACPPCLGYVGHLWGTRIQKYIQKLTSKTKPKLILVCMIYYPDETHSPGWAGPALSALGYNTNPEKLQLMIRKVFQQAISRITIQGSRVVPVPLYHVMNGKDTSDYIARVEPSASGGRKMAEYLLEKIENPHNGNSHAFSYQMQR